MLSHIFIGATDFDRALAFYSALAKVLEIQPRFVQADRPWAGWQSTPGPRPLLLIGTPFNGQPHVPGNGQMVAFMARTREMVDAAHALALALGGTSEGAPGVRAEYHPHYYGAYFRDSEGNKLCVVCHEPHASTPAD
jgi:catechol 2,3-dioxygenase-like lactoylglutathione lyase family enzyme